MMPATMMLTRFFVVSDDVLSGLCTYSDDSDNDKKDHDTDPNTWCQ